MYVMGCDGGIGGFEWFICLWRVGGDLQEFRNGDLEGVADALHGTGPGETLSVYYPVERRFIQAGYL